MTNQLEAHFKKVLSVCEMVNVAQTLLFQDFCLYLESFLLLNEIIV